MKFDENGWLLPSILRESNKAFNIDIIDIQSLLQLAQEEDIWSESIRQTIQRRVENPELQKEQHLDWILEDFMIKSIAGTTVSMPFGKDIITFDSNRHFFRGENKQFAQSLPSLNRKLKGLIGEEKELYKAIACMRAYQFYKFIWQFNIVPYWEAKISDINIDALAQHYGFETCLLDLTNDFRTALFFATCKYDYATDSYRPLTQKEIDQSEESKYGIIFHAPNWVLDYLNSASFEWNFYHMNDRRDVPYSFYSGELDGLAFQIGFQPFMRCHYQSGYIFPMMNSCPLQQNNRFEQLRFKQSVSLSNYVFEMMDGGKKVFPNEGIGLVIDTIRKIQTSKNFSEDDIRYAYEFCEIGNNYWSDVNEFKETLCNCVIEGSHIIITDVDPQYVVSKELLNQINEQYSKIDFNKLIGNIFHRYPEQEQYREKRCIEIYGELI